MSNFGSALVIAGAFAFSLFMLAWFTVLPTLGLLWTLGVLK